MFMHISNKNIPHSSSSMKSTDASLPNLLNFHLQSPKIEQDIVYLQTNNYDKHK